MATRKLRRNLFRVLLDDDTTLELVANFGDVVKAERLARRRDIPDDSIEFGILQAHQVAVRTGCTVLDFDKWAATVLDIVTPTDDEERPVVDPTQTAAPSEQP